MICPAPPVTGVSFRGWVSGITASPATCDHVGKSGHVESSATPVIVQQAGRAPLIGEAGHDGVVGQVRSAFELVAVVVLHAAIADEYV